MNRKNHNNVQTLTDAQRQLVVDHLSLAMNMGRKYAALGRAKAVPMEDLQQEACYGLCIAAMHYDADRQTDFRTFAYDWCRKYIMMALNDKTALSSSDDCDWDRLDTPDDDEQQDAPQCEMYATRIEAMLSILSSKEREVVCLVYGLSYTARETAHGPMSFCEVAQLLHIPSTRIRQIYNKAFKKMQSAR